VTTHMLLRKNWADSVAFMLTFPMANNGDRAIDLKKLIPADAEMYMCQDKETGQLYAMIGLDGKFFKVGVANM
jgi:hypothetical protein